MYYRKKTYFSTYNYWSFKLLVLLNIYISQMQLLGTDIMPIIYKFKL